MHISEASRLVGRSPDTLRRWEEEGLIVPDRDGRRHRVYRDSDIARCLELARYSEAAQILNRPLSEVVPQQLSLFGSSSK
jgi:DNA-binding transcriptional MerR regulator